MKKLEIIELMDHKKKSIVAESTMFDYLDSGDNQRQTRIAQILSEGIYAYLKEQGLLKEDLERGEGTGVSSKEAEEGNESYEEDGIRKQIDSKNLLT
jgi:hypothetical protein